MPDTRRFTKLVLVGAFISPILGLCLVGQGREQSQQSKENSDRNSQYEVLVKGVAASRAAQIQFQTAPVRLEIRNLVMGHGQTETIPVQAQILMELRQGSVVSSINQEKRERKQGDFWVVEKGSSLTLQNPGELAVVRAIYIFEGNP